MGRISDIRRRMSYGRIVKKTVYCSLDIHWAKGAETNVGKNQ